MDALQLLSAALSSTGHIAIVGIKQGVTVQKFHAPGAFQAAIDEVSTMVQKGYDTYFCTSTLVTDANRRGENVQYVKTLKLDLDIETGNSKKYVNQAEAVADLKRFCKAVGLPRPTLVNSGYGVHVYWPLTVAMLPDQAKLVSEKFKAVCAYHKLRTDPTVTADLARILRVPDTTNFKDPAKPMPVTMLSKVLVHETEDIIAIIENEYAKSGGVNETVPALGFAIPAHLQNMSLDATSKALVTGKPKKFSKILALSQKGQGCNQIKDIYNNQAEVEEPRWRAGISIAHFCEDGPTAIHQLSDMHPGYDPAETERKAAMVKGPYTCQTFKENWASGCEGCKFSGKIKSPIQIGEYVPMAAVGDNMVLAQNKAVDTEEVPYVIPAYPFPYQRGKNGGVFLPVEGTDGEDDIIEIYKYDFYMVKRLKDEKEGYMAQFRVHFPKDGVVDFIIDAADIGSADKLREHLNSQGILLFDKEVALMRGYVRCWFDSLSRAQEVDRVKVQFGWTEGFKSFVIGDREITGDTVRYSPAAPSIAPLIKHMGRRGDVTEWRRVFNVYSMDGFEAHAFGAMCGFGSVLLAFTPLKGALVNLMSPESGTGKSTVLKVVCSMWGDPEGLMTSFKDTPAARTHRMGVLKNIPVCVDEVTTLNEEAIQDLVFSATQGKGKNRMSSSANAERENNTTWASITISSANANFREKLQASKSGVEGELMRLMDVPVPESDNLGKTEADRLFGALAENYGWAGEIFVKYVINNMDKVRRMITLEQEALDRDGDMSNKERFWSAVMSCALVATMITRELGLHDMDPAKMRRWELEFLRTLRHGVGQSTKSSENDILNEFINAHLGETLVVSTGTGSAASLVPSVLKEPRNTVMIRYEMDTEQLMILQSEFKKYCKDHNVFFDQFIDEMKRKGVYLEAATKRIAAGTSMPSPSVRVLIFKMSKDAVPMEQTS